MHVHSFVPILGFISLVPVCTALPSDANTVSKRDLNVSNNIPVGWVHDGCYTDDPARRGVSAAYHTDAALTENKCIQYCGERGYSIAAVEYGQECFCSFEVAAPSVRANTESECNMACSGAAEERCGGPSRMNVFVNSANRAPTTNPGPNGWTSLDCYTDSVGARTLANAMHLQSVTVASCTSACQSAGYQFAGVEYANECYCGNSIQNGAAPASSGCNMVCSGNSMEYCGGANRLNLYQWPTIQTPAPGPVPDGWTSKGCYTDKVGARALPYGANVAGGARNNTIEGCLNACSAAGYSIAGLEWSQECFCGDELQNNAGPAASGCDMTCSGNGAELCGGPERLNIYQLGSSTPPATTTTTTTTTTTGTTTTTVAAATTSAACSIFASDGRYISNAGFEYGFDYWSGQVSRGEWSSTVTNDGTSLQGCSALMLNATDTSSSQQYFFYQTINGAMTTSPAQHTFHFSQGRISASSKDVYGPYIDVYYGGQILISDRTACGNVDSACTQAGKNGTVWETVEIIFEPISARDQLVLVVTYTDAGPHEPVLFDRFGMF